MINPSLTPTMLIAGLLFSPLALAENSVQLSPIVVYSKLKPSFDHAPNATYMNEQDLQRSGQRELSQVLRGTPGLSISQGMKGGPSNLSLRGASGGMGLINIDGIPLHDLAPGMTPLDLFPAETFGSSDIQRGSSAILNFGRSLGGSINLHSRDNPDQGARLHVEGGSFGSLRETATADMGNADHQLNLTAGRDDLFDGTHWADSKQGNSERDDFHAHQLAMHMRDQFSERVKLDSSIYYVNGDSGIDKVGLTKPTPEFGIVDDPGRLKQEIWLAQNTIGIDLYAQWHSELQLGYTDHRVKAVIGNILPGSAPQLLGFDNQLSLARWKNSHRFWLDTQQKRGLQFNWGGEGLYEQGQSLNSNFGGQRSTGSGFANLQGDWDDWQGTMAVRADHFDNYGAHAVYHAGLNWRMTKHLHWFINGGSGYRPPSFNEMLMWPAGNPDLKPEQSVGGEGGLRWQFNNNTQFSTNFFHSRYIGLIKVERSTIPLGLYLINNIPHAQIQGLETQWSTHWITQLTTGIDYTWTDSKNNDTNKPLPRQPKHIARLWSEWACQTLPLKLWLQGIYRGNSFDTGGTTIIGDSFNLDMQLSYQINSPLSLYLRGENLTDNRQSQVFGWDMPGAAVYGGFKWMIL
ncbi:MAG: TonB-dependent receptor plug domain-containing protein [Methylobacter sp.]